MAFKRYGINNNNNKGTGRKKESKCGRKREATIEFGETASRQSLFNENIECTLFHIVFDIERACQVYDDPKRVDL